MPRVAGRRRSGAAAVRIRIAQKAACNGGNCESMDDVIAGYAMPWIELDGHRITDVAAATFTAGRGEIQGVTLTLDAIGPVQLVYIDHDGNEIGEVEHPDPGAIGRIDSATVIERPR